MDEAAPFLNSEIVPAVVGALLLFLLAWIILFYPRHHYSVEGKFLVIRKRLLWSLPFGTIRIPLDNIERAEKRAAWPPLPVALHYSNSFAFGLVLVTLKRPRYLLFRKLLLTPEDPVGFVNTLSDEPEFRKLVGLGEEGGEGA